MNPIKRIGFAAVVALAAVTALAQQNAEQILKAAQAKARTEKKAIFIRFDASW